MSVIFNGVKRNHIGRLNQWACVYMCLGHKSVDNWQEYSVTFHNAKYIVHKTKGRYGEVEHKTDGIISRDAFDIYPKDEGTVINAALTNNA